ncbi:hypothetical protein ACMGE7_01755 [Macrococcus equi]|uniref:hypothetical protein n=1 Tax=Macrococcus equi TaxID=3395462 RepID=UPI0039BE51A2
MAIKSVSSIQNFWKAYTTYPDNTPENVANFAAFHPYDLAHFQEKYPHFFEEITHLKGRKLQERLKFEQHLYQVNGMYVLDDNNNLVKDENHIHIWVPEPYAGNFEQAKILILLVNPAFNPKYHPMDQEKRIKFDNLHRDLPDYSPYEFTNGQLNKDNKLNWHYHYMYQHIERDIGYFHPNQLFTLQYYAYPSYTRDDITFYNELLPSQIAAIQTVKEAMDRGLTIIARSTDRTRWLSHIPELAQYKKLFVFTNFKQPALHPDEVIHYDTYRKKEILTMKGMLKDARKRDWKLLIQDIEPMG